MSSVTSVIRFSIKNSISSAAVLSSHSMAFDIDCSDPVLTFAYVVTHSHSITDNKGCQPLSTGRTTMLLLQWAFPFGKPVDVNLFKDYPVIIKQPMDFATIKAKADSGAYKGPQDFFDDMKLVFTNARRYNPPGSDVNLMASGVEVGLKPMRMLLSARHSLCSDAGLVKCVLALYAIRSSRMPV